MPRLSKGQTALGTLAKTSAAKRSVQRRVEIFYLMVEENDLSSKHWVNFNSVDSLAMWHDKDLGIEPVSPKTLRKHMAHLFDGGLANLLKCAKDNIGKPELSPNRISRAAELEAKTRLAVDSSLEMTARYLDLLERLQKLSKDNELARLELTRHFRRYEQNPHLKVIK
ncbi:hypothetical protein ABVN23_10370 [Pseudomonas fluorescens]|uniref:hypothetical protein n=1 Tax=Pseudomonas fluorescens TaxID=294 RepID=UPI003F958B04